MPNPFQIELLGGFRTTYGGALVTDLGTPRLQALLAYIALHHGTPQPRQHIAFTFWPDSTEKQALTNLHQLLHALPGAAIEQHVAYAAQLPSIQSTMHRYPIDGAVHQVGSDETAWSYRDATWAMVIIGISPNPSNNDQLRTWTRNYWEALHPYSAGGAYANMMMEEGTDCVQASYRDTYERLASIKAKYDPNNLFRVNQNIPPAA